MVSEGWSSTKLGSLVKIYSGVAPADLLLKTEGKLPYVKVEDMNIGLKYQVDSRLYVDESPIVVPKGATLFPKRGAAIMNNKVRIADVDFVIDSNMMAIFPAKGLDQEFLYYLILHLRLYKIADTSTIPQINNKHILPLKVGIPSLSEQKIIAKILSTWDQALTTAEQLLANSQQQKKALMQLLLSGKQRLPEFSSKWQTVRFGEAFRERVETGFIELPLLSITSEEGVIDREETGRKDTSNADKSKYLRICPGDIGYNTMRMWQGVSGLSALEGLVSPAYTVLTPQLGIDPLFAAYLFKLPSLVHVFYRHSQGLVSDTWNLKYANFAKIKWSIPGVEEQKAIAAVLSSADREVESLQQQLAGLKQEKKALMQQLLTGKRRVNIDET